MLECPNMQMCRTSALYKSRTEPNGPYFRTSHGPQGNLGGLVGNSWLPDLYALGSLLISYSGRKLRFLWVRFQINRCH